MSGFEYYPGLLSVTLRPEMTADDVTTASTCGMIVGRQVPHNDTKFLLLNASRRLEVMQRLHVKGIVG